MRLVGGASLTDAMLSLTLLIDSWVWSVDGCGTDHSALLVATVHTCECGSHVWVRLCSVVRCVWCVVHIVGIGGSVVLMR